MNKPRFLRIGLIGFSIVVLLNLFAAYALDFSSATPFTSFWYSAWLPAYVVWLVFFVLGVKEKRDEESS